MRYTITGRNLNVSDNLKGTIEGKLDKLAKYFSEDTEATVRLGKDGDFCKIEVTIPTKVGLIRAEESNRDLHSAIDDVEDIIEKQIKKHKTKLIDKKQSATSFSQMFMEEEAVDDEDEIKIVKTKSFALKPMDPEEACLQMEMLGHNFFVFLNMDTNEVNVVYKRKGDSYGLIEPEI